MVWLGATGVTDVMPLARLPKLEKLYVDSRFPNASYEAFARAAPCVEVKR